MEVDLVAHLDSLVPVITAQFRLNLVPQEQMDSYHFPQCLPFCVSRITRLAQVMWQQLNIHDVIGMKQVTRHPLVTSLAREATLTGLLSSSLERTLTTWSPPSIIFILGGKLSSSCFDGYLLFFVIKRSLVTLNVIRRKFSQNRSMKCGISRRKLVGRVRGPSGQGHPNAWVF